LALVATKALNMAGYAPEGKAADALKIFANGFAFADETAVNAILTESQSFISTIQK
jgi:PPE-repeat protein